MLWKIYFYFISLVTVAGFFISGLSFTDMLSSVVFAVACVGLFGYCYKKKIGSKVFWKYFFAFAVTYTAAYSTVLDRYSGVPSTNSSDLVIASLFSLPLFIGIYLYVKWFDNLQKLSEKQLKKQAKKSIKKVKSSTKKYIIFGTIALILLVSVNPLMNALTIAGAPKHLILLADNSGMSTTGKLMFLRASPEVVESNDIVSKCGNLASETIEQGCFDPNSSKIYIRNMPVQLDNIEVVTAAHEMLHIAYSKYNDQERQSINKQLETTYQQLANDELKARMDQYEKVEPGQKYNELFSIIGTEYQYLSGNLNREYNKYFFDRTKTVVASNSINEIFNNYETKLNDLNSQINTAKADSDSLYNSHSRAARNGDEYYANYYYRLYSDKYNYINRLIDEYNNNLNGYNILVKQYNGREYAPIDKPDN